MQWFFRVSRAESNQRPMAGYSGEDSVVLDAQRYLQGLGPPGMEVAPEGDRLRYPVGMSLEVDDGFNVPLTLLEGNAGAVIEGTQRLREQREREKTSVRPVYNFGSESYGSTGSEC